MANSKKQKVAIIVLSVVLVVVSGLAVFFGITTYKAKYEAVARVGDARINKMDLYEELEKVNGKSALESLINLKIVDLELKKSNITITDEEIEKDYQKIVEGYGGKEAFLSLLKEYSYTEEDFKKDIRSNLGIRKLIEPTITVTEEEIKQYFETNRANYEQKEQVRASHILVDDEATAKEVKEKLAAGADFAELAKQYSNDGSKDKGGDLGYFTKDKMVEAFSKAAFSLEVNGISDPVKTQYGYHIIKVVDKKPAVEAKLEDHKDEIKEMLIENKINSAADSWFQKKREEHKIEKFL